ncbi:uncharacterized protein [Panulirus ornatus]|uniref:uncharacterized protein n=1 Tax=Panulirus ornatus TaxID=150431 RepID=UPI003A8C545E
MHFWIDKRSVCGQRRRAPPLLSSTRPYGPKPRYCSMVTPVHRFQRIESMQLDTRRCAEGGRGRYNRGRRPGSTSRPPTDDEDESVRVHLAETTSSTTPGEEVCLTRLNVPSNHTSRRTSANSSVYSRVPDNFNLFRMGGINWCVWAAFIVITMLLVPAHLYLKNFDYRGELIGIFFVIILLFLVCFSVSLFHTKTRAILLHRLNLEDDARGCNQDSETSSPFRRRPLFPRNTLTHNRSSRRLSLTPVRVSMSTPNLLINGQVTSERDPAARPPIPVYSRGNYEGALRPYENMEHRAEASPASDASSDPPPYHVAVMLPTPSQPPASRDCETPPPAYEIVQ